MDEAQGRVREKVMGPQGAGGLSREDAGWVGPVVYYAREIRRICAEVAEA
jgi:hypothetical protein